MSLPIFPSMGRALGRNMPGQISARPTQFCRGRADPGCSKNPLDPKPQAWIWVSSRPRQFCLGRKLVENAGVEQILAREGSFSTLAILPGSSRIWPRPDLARPRGQEKLGFASEKLGFAAEKHGFCFRNAPKSTSAPKMCVGRKLAPHRSV